MSDSDYNLEMNYISYMQQHKSNATHTAAFKMTLTDFPQVLPEQSTVTIFVKMS